MSRQQKVTRSIAPNAFKRTIPMFFGSSTSNIFQFTRVFFWMLLEFLAFPQVLGIFYGNTWDSPFFLSVHMCTVGTKMDPIPRDTA